MFFAIIIFKKICGFGEEIREISEASENLYDARTRNVYTCVETESCKKGKVFHQRILDF